jgi:hypothetical protein
MNVIGVPPSITLAQFNGVLLSHKAPIDAIVAERVYTMCVWLEIDPAFFLALWLYEQGTPFGKSEIGRRTFNPLNIKAYGRWPYISIRGVRWNAYESWQLGLFAAILHLKQFYGARGYTDVESIVTQFAPATDNNDVDAYIRAVLRDMAAMRGRR